MSNQRLRLAAMVTAAIATSAVAGAQTTNSPTGSVNATPGATDQTYQSPTATSPTKGGTNVIGGQPANPAGPGYTDPNAPVTSTVAQPDNTTPDNNSGRRGFNWGLLGLLGLLGLVRGKEVRRDTYASTTPGARTNVGTGAVYDERIVTPRAASSADTRGYSGPRSEGTDANIRS